MTFDEKEVKMDYLQHFIEGGGYPVRINPKFTNGEILKSPEEEMLTIMYIQEEMPYLDVSDDNLWEEALVSQRREIPNKDKVEFFSYKLNEVREEYYSLLDKLSKLVGF